MSSLSEAGSVFWIKRNELTFSAITPLSAYETFKPHSDAYEVLPEFYNRPRREICVVSSNLKFGDLESARNHGMQSIYLNRDIPNGYPEAPTNLKELADLLIKRK